MRDALRSEDAVEAYQAKRALQKLTSFLTQSALLRSTLYEQQQLFAAVANLQRVCPHTYIALNLHGSVCPSVCQWCGDVR